MYEFDADGNGSPGFCEAGRARFQSTFGPDTPSKWDLFAGYSYLAPKGDLISGTTQDSAKSVSCCAIVSLARYFNNYVGVQAELGDS